MAGASTVDGLRFFSSSSTWVGSGARRGVPEVGQQVPGHQIPLRAQILRNRSLDAEMLIEGLTPAHLQM